MPTGTTPIPQPSTTGFSIQDIALLLASTKKDHLPEWKLAQYSGDPLHWHEWFGQFKYAIDAAPLTDDVKLTYLKTLVTGKAKTAISEFAYCGAMYRDALKTLERKFGQPQTVVTAYLDKLSNFSPVKMHNSESIISYSANICSLVGVFRSLNYLQYLSSASLLGQAVQKLPPNMKEAWSMHTVKRTLDWPTLIDFNDWLKDKAEAHKFLLRQPRQANKVLIRRVKWNNYQTVSPVKTNIRCGDVQFSEKRHLRKERKLWQTISSVFHASNPIALSDSVHSLASAPKMHVEAHTTPFCTELSGYSQKIPSEATKWNPKHQVALVQRREARNQKKAQAQLPSQT